MAVTDNTTWLILGGLAIGLVALMLMFSTPDAANDVGVLPKATEEIVATATAEEQAADTATVYSARPSVVRAPAVQRASSLPPTGAPCGCKPAVQPACPVSYPCEPVYVAPARSYDERCEPMTPPCEDPCTPHIRPPDRYEPPACACVPCWPDPQEPPCDTPNCEPVRMPHPFWPEAEHECRRGIPPTPLIERNVQQWVVEGGQVQLHGTVSNPHYIDVCFQWSADRGSFDDPSSLHPVYIAPKAQRWGDSVCITLTTFDSCGGRRYDQLRLRVNPRVE